MPYMIQDPDGPGIPAYGIKPQKPAPKKPRQKEPKPLCLFNDGVECSTFKCENCGFNPKRKDGTHES